MHARARMSTRALLVAGALVLGACDRPPVPATGDTTLAGGPLSPAESVATVVSASGWDVETGPFVVLPTVDGGMSAGSLLRPEATELTVGDTTGVGQLIADGRLELFSRSGRVGEARLAVEQAPRTDPGCTAWPVARLGQSAAGATSPANAPVWTAAFAAGRVEAIPLDSIEGLNSRDSARLAIELTRLASALPDDTSATFRGLPFVVLRAFRSTGLDTGFVVATLARRVNQEDAPQEERLVLVVNAAGDPKGWKVGWHERAAGHEEELVVAEPLLAYRPRANRTVHLLFGRDDGVALGAAVLVRGEGGWKVQWESAVAGCD